jgi:hypothetical protein
MTQTKPPEERVLIFRAPRKAPRVPEYDWDGGPPKGSPGMPMRFPFVPQPADLDGAAEQRLAA